MNIFLKDGLIELKNMYDQLVNSKFRYNGILNKDEIKAHDKLNKEVTTIYDLYKKNKFNLPLKDANGNYIKATPYDYINQFSKTYGIPPSELAREISKYEFNDKIKKIDSIEKANGLSKYLKNGFEWIINNPKPILGVSGGFLLLYGIYRIFKKYNKTDKINKLKNIVISFKNKKLKELDSFKNERIDNLKDLKKKVFKEENNYFNY